MGKAPREPRTPCAARRNRPSLPCLPLSRPVAGPALRCVLVALRDVVLVLQARGAVLARLLEPVADELAVERRGVDAEQLARALLLPAGEIQHLEDVLLLQLLERHV